APRLGPIGVTCVFSREPMTRPVAGDCAVDVAPGAALACHGYGSSVAVTATFGMVAAGWVLQALQAARAAGDMASRAGAGRSRA
ncbi:MAG: tRNA threonylcarbamoyladenosine dehydratase, partial [Ottowia sp.]|nr:tRNA threonylcarbamoyladenosine dehydratase [Ottowia sp.]